MKLYLTLALNCAFLVSPAAGGVLVVDPGGGGDFLGIQAAVEAALDGDTILVKTGTYGTVLINGKGVSILSDAGATVRIDGGLRVVNSLPFQTVVIEGLAVFGVNDSVLIEGIGLYINANQGPVRARSCSFEGAWGEGENACDPQGHIDGWAGAFLLNSPDVSFVDCTILGGAGAGPNGAGAFCYTSTAGDGGIGVDVFDSTLALCTSAVQGGDGGPTGISSGEGGLGLRIKGPLGAVASVQSSFTGGDGGEAWDFISVMSGDGGHGAQIQAAASMTSFEDSFAGGAPGFTFVCCAGSPGSPLAGTGALAQLGTYCTAGTTASGCAAAISVSGTPSASAPSGFLLQATTVEGQKDGLFFFGINGVQANSWGNGTSLQCVVPPVMRGALLAGSGSTGACNGSFDYDLAARWTQQPAQNPGGGAVVQAQLWFRDPQNTSNQTTSLSDAIEFLVCP